MVITENDDVAIQYFKLFHCKQFHINDLENHTYFLCSEVARSKTVKTSEIIDDVVLLGAKPIDFPMEQNLKLTNVQGEQLSYPSSYMRLED